MTLVKVKNPINNSFDGLLNDLFSELPLRFSDQLRDKSMQYPPVNITEKKDAYQVELAAPGMDKSDFTVKMDGDLLTISGEKKKEEVENTQNRIRREFSYQSFKRSFTVNDNIDATKINAKYNNGILVLELPKREEVKKLSKAIEIS